MKIKLTLTMGILSLFLNKLSGQSTFNPTTFEKGLWARYPNGTKLIENPLADKDGNKEQLMYENGLLLTHDKFSGVVYINETTYEVYSGKGENRKSGLFKIGNIVDWTAETPRQKINKAYEEFVKVLNENTNELNDKCYCSFPRIIDYIEHRRSDDQMYIQNKFKDTFLVVLNSSYNQNTRVETINLECVNCKSTYEWNYEERGIDQITLNESKNNELIGKNIEVKAPNYLKALSDELFCDESYIYRQNLYKSDLVTMMNYLFERK